jgi:hypothetical protein
MKKVLLIGYGLAAETFLYCLFKSIKESDESVKLYRTSLGSVKEPRQNIRACFYIHKFLDEQLTPQTAIRKYKFSVDGYEGVASERYYDLKVFGEYDQTDAHKRIREVNNYGDSQDYFCGKEFCKNLVGYGRSMTGELTLSGQLDIIDRREIDLRRFLDDKNFDLIIQAEPLHRLVEDSGVYASESWMDNFKIYPIGIRIRTCKAADLGVLFDVEVKYNVNEFVRFYREVSDPFDQIVITEYSFGYGKNSMMLYNGGIISPGKILRNDFAQDFINSWTVDYGNMIFLGRYAKWCPNTTITMVYGESMDVIRRYLLCQ